MLHFLLLLLLLLLFLRISHNLLRLVSVWHLTWLDLAACSLLCSALLCSGQGQCVALRICLCLRLCLGPGAKPGLPCPSSCWALRDRCARLLQLPVIFIGLFAAHKLLRGLSGEGRKQCLIVWCIPFYWLLLSGLPLLVAACRRRCWLPRIMAVNGQWVGLLPLQSLLLLLRCLSQFDLFVSQSVVSSLSHSLRASVSWLRLLAPPTIYSSNWVKWRTAPFHLLLLLLLFHLPLSIRNYNPIK